VRSGQPLMTPGTYQSLFRRRRWALRVHPTTAVPSPDGSDAVKRILGGITTVASGVAELRNRGYGTGHGRSRPPAGLSARHAHLAVGAVRLWCEFMLDTLGDPSAPWRKNANGA
jgi:Abortive infection C-terminus